MHLKIIKIIKSKTENLQGTITMQGFQGVTLFCEPKCSYLLKRGNGQCNTRILIEKLLKNFLRSPCVYSKRLCLIFWCPGPKSQKMIEKMLAHSTVH